MVTVTVGQGGLLFTKPGSGLVRTQRPRMSAPLRPATCCTLLAIHVLVQDPIRCSPSSCSGSHAPNTRGSGAGCCHTGLAASGFRFQLSIVLIRPQLIHPDLLVRIPGKPHARRGWGRDDNVGHAQVLVIQDGGLVVVVVAAADTHLKAFQTGGLQPHGVASAGRFLGRAGRGRWRP